MPQHRITKLTAAINEWFIAKQLIDHCFVTNVLLKFVHKLAVHFERTMRMNIEIGKKIRELRSERFVTQEQLAVFLGVTPQAVSRWESQYSYPDMELLPAIADYFSVTTDELLGIRKKERELRLVEIKKEIPHLIDEGTLEENIDFARQAVAEFPSEESFQLYLADSLQRLIWTENPNKALVEEAEKIYLTILETTKDVSIQCQAIEGLVTHYAHWLKDDVRTLEMADRLPSLEYCREFAKALCVRNNREIYLQKAIELCTTYLTLSIKELVFESELPDDKSSLERKIRMLKTANEIIRMIFGEDMMYHHARVSFYAKHMSTIQLALERTDDALDSLEEMTRHAIACDASYENDHGKHFTSPFVDSLIYTGESSDFPDSKRHNQCWYCLELLTDNCYDCLKENERFRTMIKELERRAK